MHHKRVHWFLAAIFVLSLGSSTSASVVVGGSSLLTQAYADQLEAWLGEGPVVLTRIFEKQAGDDASDFHTAVDLKGRTFSVMEVIENTATDLATGLVNNPRQIIGGYNPQSWDGSLANFRFTPAVAERTAFLFNLTTDEIRRQSLRSETFFDGTFQTYNHFALGPTFGGGHDIYVASDLTEGNLNSFSFGGIPDFDNILGGANRFHAGAQMFGAIEVFTIAPAATGAVPEPLSLLVWGGLAIFAFATFRDVRRTPHPLFVHTL